MATLSKPVSRAYEFDSKPIYNNLPVVAADIIYEGSALGEVASTGVGHVRPAVGSATPDIFHGFADETVDNSGGAAGAKLVRVRSQGVVQLAVAAEPANNFLGATVYCTDDDTFTFTSTNAVPIGKALRKVSAGVYMVAFQAAGLRSI